MMASDKSKVEPVNIDSLPENADWAKRTCDWASTA